jgi:hypothetical protein
MRVKAYISRISFARSNQRSISAEKNKSSASNLPVHSGIPFNHTDTSKIKTSATMQNRVGRRVPPGTSILKIFSYKGRLPQHLILPQSPSDDYIPYPPKIQVYRKPEFRSLLIEQARIVDLKLQVMTYTNKYGADKRRKATADALQVYRSFRVLPVEDGETMMTVCSNKF